MKKISVYFSKTILFNNINIMIIAILIDAIIGDPAWLYKKIAHPVAYIGKLINILDQNLNKEHYSPQHRKLNGFITVFLIAFIPALGGTIIQKLIKRFCRPFTATILLGSLASTLIAQRSLYNHVIEVKNQIDHTDLQKARYAVSMIVGRNTKDLDYSSICRAAIESLAENFSDGVIAPILWGCIGGLPGILIYKSINTADSMIGHTTKKYQQFGYAAAKTDDYINYPASRFSALLILLGKRKQLLHNLKSTSIDAKTHNSPNAGWPEAAMAHSLSIQLAGPRHYQEKTVNTPWIGKGRHIVFTKDIQKALTLFIKACSINLLILLTLSCYKQLKNRFNMI